MFGGIMTKVLGGALIASLIFGGVTYVQKIRAERRADDERQLREVAEANLQIAEKTIKVFREWENIDEVMENSDDDVVVDYLRTGVWPKDYRKAGNRPAPLPGATAPGKPGEGQK